jgi:hypothetical protein
LAGTHEVGTQGTNAAEWAVKFDTLTFNSFLVATGNLKDWVIAHKDCFSADTGDILSDVTITSSSKKSSPDIKYRNNAASDTDPYL